MRAPVTAAVLSLALLAAPAGAVAVPDDRAPTTSPAASHSQPGADRTAERRVPRLRVKKRVRGLDHPWDVKAIDHGRVLVTERDRARLLVTGEGGKQRVRFPSRRVLVRGEIGLMSLEVDPRFERNRRIYTCQGWRTKRGGDVRVIAWRLNRNATGVRKAKTLVRGLDARKGRHGGCRLLITSDGALVVGTGDAAIGTLPRRLSSLNGKTLRVNRFTGKPWPGNPWANARGKRRFVLTYGHRNVQGLAERRDGTVWSAEHGPFVDDEVNRLRPGGDYGWHPVPGYNESVPMTNHRLPGRQVGARWRSGRPTVATSGATFVYGKEWGRLNGTLAVACLKGERVLFLRFNSRGRLRWTRAPRELRGIGRLRSITQLPNGSLAITTDRDSDGDSVLIVRPRR